MYHARVFPGMGVAAVTVRASASRRSLAAPRGMRNGHRAEDFNTLASTLKKPFKIFLNGFSNRFTHAGRSPYVNAPRAAPSPHTVGKCTTRPGGRSPVSAHLIPPSPPLTLRNGIAVACKASQLRCCQIAKSYVDITTHPK